MPARVVLLCLIALGGLVGCGTVPSAGRAGSATTTPSELTDPPPAAAELGASFSQPVLRASVEASDLAESSGLAASRTEPGLLWTHNDSGDGPFVYCVGLGGDRCGVWRVTGAQADDWEDMAAGPGPEPGRSYLYFGDIGDNDEERSSVTVYRVPEPTPALGDTSTRRAPRATAAAEAITLRYADGPHDAEGLLVHPETADVYLLTKAKGSAGVYRADGSGVLRRVASVDLEGDEWVTGGDVSPDGRRVALATPLGGIELALDARGEGSFDTVWARRPVAVDLGLRAQGESVAYRLDGLALLATSELEPMPLWEAVRSGGARDP